MTHTHTPGPWVIGSRHTNQGVYTVDGDLIANTHGSQRNFNRDEQIAEQDANARLIAAAPEVTDAAAALIADVRRRHPNEELRCPYMIALDAAIAKARGQ
jgi:hypothetical protein